ncbi:hypothetical protein DFJ74DRAFT_304783 [Hyaloraphidium curvatum]|nr:hypothetical protein DFJ74DRAFT_304783 [Hyaloraphidium curvatum]
MEQPPESAPPADTAAKASGFFSPADLYAAFPLPLPPAGPWDRDRPRSDPAGALRSELRSWDSLRSALEPHPTLLTLVGWGRVLWWMPVTLFPRYTAMGAAVAAFCATMFPFGADSFGRTQLVGGYVLVALHCAAYPILWFAGQVVLIKDQQLGGSVSTWDALRAGLRANAWPTPWKGALEDTWCSALAILPPWARRVGDPSSGTALGHVEGDVDCTCAAPRCGGGLVSAAVRHWVGDVAVRVAFASLWIFVAWTPLFGLPQVWTHAWSIFLAVCFCSVTAMSAVEQFSYPASEFGLLKLEGRVRRRLTRRALAAFLDRARRTVLDGDDFKTPSELWGSSDEPYIQLHTELRPRWSHAVGSSNLPAAYPFLILLLVAFMATSIIIGSCIPAWMISWVAYAFYVLFRDLWIAGVANAEVAAIGDLYSSALTELRNLLVAATPPPPKGSPWAPHLAAHAAALERYAAEAAAPGRTFLGFVVRFGSLRALLVSLLTVAFAAWGLARGFGVGAVLDTVCPG